MLQTHSVTKELCRGLFSMIIVDEISLQLIAWHAD